MAETIIDLKGITKTYFLGKENEFNAITDINLKINEGEFVAIVGASGSGKSTLMNIIGALDKPTKGEYYFKDVKFNDLSDVELSAIRNKKIGFIFQTFNLISRLNSIKNIEMPMTYAGIKPNAKHKRAEELLKLVGMEKRMKHFPNELSGGEKQRVAIARSLANDPDIILADEPTGALDSKTGRIVMDILHKLHKEQHKTIIFITHSNELSLETERIITISDGKIISDLKNRSSLLPKIAKNKGEREQ